MGQIKSSCEQINIKRSIFLEKKNKGNKFHLYMDKRKQYNINIIILGQDNVGKSFLTSTFQKEKIAKDGKIVNFNILDTDETIDNCDVAQAAIVVYDITNKDSFIHAQCLIRKLHHYAKSDILIALIGNKKDLESSLLKIKKEFIYLRKKDLSLKNYI